MKSRLLRILASPKPLLTIPKCDKCNRNRRLGSALIGSSASCKVPGPEVGICY